MCFVLRRRWSAQPVSLTDFRPSSWGRARSSRNTEELHQSVHPIFAFERDAPWLALRRHRGGGMFGRVVFVATLCVTAALLGSFSLLERLPAPAPVAAADAAAPAAVLPPSDNAAAEDAGRRVFSYRETALRADGRGQYAADALVNGLPVRMLVDTAASDVVVSASTAARLGLARSGERERADPDRQRQVESFARRAYSRQFRRHLYERR